VLLDALATQIHYLDHVGLVFKRIPAEYRGTLYVPPELELRAHQRLGDGFVIVPDEHVSPSDNPVLVASFADIQGSAGRRHVLMEHGVGQSYKPYINPAYAGGPGRQSVELFLCPNEYSADLNQQAYPEAAVEVIGSPHLEHLMGLLRHDGGRTIAFGWHFDLQLCQETTNGWSHFSPAVQELAAHPEWEVLGHAHPRIFRDLAPTYKAWGVEPVKDFDKIVERASVYVADNSSSLFDFAAVVGPVVVMNPPQYRREVNHGLRFWEAADVGPQVSDPAAVLPAAKQALAGWSGKEAALDQVYAAVEDPAGTAAEVILKVLSGRRLKAEPRPLIEFPRTARKLMDAIAINEVNG